MIRFLCVILLYLSGSSFALPQSKGGSEMVLIKGGEYLPLYGVDSQKAYVSDFYMDIYPVSNADYLTFVKSNEKWQKSKVKPIFADQSYLHHWKSDFEPGAKKLSEAVNHVSWFAAKNYCNCQGKRLPTIDEWEYAAMADETSADARDKETYNQYILDWYAKPTTITNLKIGETPKNYWGVYDLHGLLWEWTADFNAVMISGESRKDVDVDRNLFCSGGAIGATDLMNYAAFMRYAYRGSLKANYNIKNLGFRCVKDVK